MVTPEDKLLDDLMGKAQESAMETLTASTDVEAGLAEAKTLAQMGASPEQIAEMDHFLDNPETGVTRSRPVRPIP